MSKMSILKVFDSTKSAETDRKTKRNIDPYLGCAAHRLLSAAPMASKATTGLVGIAVEANIHQKLGAYYKKLVATLGNLPAESEYRKKTEAVTNHRIAMLKKYSNVSDIEEAIGGGQVEEILIQTKNEIKLAQNMANWRPWEPLQSDAPPGQWDWP